MNLKWFYVSLVCLIGVLFDHTILPLFVPAGLTGQGRFWMVVFGLDALFLIGGFVGIVLALFLSTKKEEEERDRAERTP